MGTGSGTNRPTTPASPYSPVPVPISSQAPRTPNRARWRPAILLVVAGMAVAAWSAPMVPRNRALAPEIASLEGLKRLRLDLAPLPAEVISAGLELDAIRASWTAALRGAGFELTSDEDAPRLELKMITIIEPNVPDAIAVNPYLLLYQDVAIQRTGRGLPLPTYANIQVGLESRKRFARPLREVLEMMIEQFIADCQRADRS